MIVLYLLLLSVFGIYSYSQIDVNLTLFQASGFLNFQHQMTQLGYFNRPISTAIFVSFIVLLSVLYYFFYRQAASDKLSIKKISLLIGGIAVIGLFSYPAFSHDIFNYIFDARVFAFHHANPYTSTALMFPDDTWTRFMNWTHRTYPYGPTFLPITVLVYFLGLNKFVLTLFWFKTLAVTAYLGSTYFLYRLEKSRAAILFALNPLIITEAIITSHLDIIMLFFSLWAYYLLVKNKRLSALVVLAVSIGIKYATVLFLPLFIWKKIPPEKRLTWLILAAYAGALLQIGTHELLPHYFIVPLGFSALSQSRILIWGIIIFSALLLILRYYSYLATGVWLTISLFH